MKLKNDEIMYDFSFFESEESLLNMTLTTRKKEANKRAKTKGKVLLGFLVVIFVFSYFARNTKFISLMIFANNDYKRCTLLNKLDLYQYNIRYIFLFFMYSYLNIYSAFCYLVLDVVANIINDLLRLGFFDSRPFWDNNNNVFPCICEFTPNYPSHTSNNSFMFLSLFYFLRKEERRNQKYAFQRNKKPKNTIYRESDDENSVLNYENSSENLSNSQYDKGLNFLSNFFLVFLIILIIFVDIIPLLQNIEYLHQTLFGLALGFSLYYLVFHIICVDHLNRKHFLSVIKQPLIILIFSVLLILVILLAQNATNNKILFSQIIQIQKYCDIPKNLNFTKDILYNCIFVFEILGSYYGIILEYRDTFKSKDAKFTLYNVFSRNKERYTDDGKIKKLVRFLLLFFIETLFFKTIIEFWIKHNLKRLFKIYALSLVFFLKGIFFFYIMKRFLSKVNLTNNKIFEESFDDEE
jgi:hypothetical protein